MEELIVRHCAPTLAGLKTGNLFGCQAEDEKCLLAGIRQVNRQFASRGIRLIPIRSRGGRVLIYMYRPQKLKEDLADGTARKILAAQNYPVSQEGKCVAYLFNWRLLWSMVQPGQSTQAHGRYTEMWKRPNAILHGLKNVPGYMMRFSGNIIRLTGSL